jgi:4-carboxymuconolactone decarboxylase
MGSLLTQFLNHNYNMRISPIKPDRLDADLRQVHDGIAALVGGSQRQVTMTDRDGALIGPFPPMLHYPQFGVPALTFIRSLDNHAKLNKKVREVAILTVGASLGARFELYAHEIMAEAFGLSSGSIATLAAGGRPNGLNDQEAIAHDIAHALVKGRIVPDSTYNYAIEILGKDEVAELYFLIGGYCLIAMILNGFNMPTPDNS